MCAVTTMTSVCVRLSLCVWQQLREGAERSGWRASVWAWARRNHSNHDRWSRPKRTNVEDLYEDFFSRTQTFGTTFGKTFGTRIENGRLTVDF